MIVSIHQPDYIPWMGFFSKMEQSDILVIGDAVQFRNKGFTNRSKIKTQKGWQWLTVPIVHQGPQEIRTIRISREERNGIAWSELHLRTLAVNYGRARHYDEYIGKVEQVLRRDWEYLSFLNGQLIRLLAGILGIKTRMVKLSELKVEGKATELILAICKKLKADTYLSGMGGMNYIDEAMFRHSGIKLLYNQYKQSTYTQQFSEAGFQPYLSILDLILNMGLESLEIIRSGFRGFEAASGL